MKFSKNIYRRKNVEIKYKNNNNNKKDITLSSLINLNFRKKLYLCLLMKSPKIIKKENIKILKEPNNNKIFDIKFSYFLFEKKLLNRK